MEMNEATRAAVARMKAVADKAFAEAQVHPDRERAANWRGGERWECENGNVAASLPFGIEWVPV